MSEQEKNTVRFKKIKNVGDKEGDSRVIILEYQQMNRFGQFDSFTMQCKEEAKPGFYLALSSLAPSVAKMCELTEGTIARIRVNGCAFSYNDTGEQTKVKLLATMTLNNGPGAVTINTPTRILSETKLKDDDDEVSENYAQMVPPEAIPVILSLIREAADYMDGDRLQQSMNLDDGGVDGKMAAAGKDE